MNCPRCTGVLTYRAFETEGGYRSNVTMRELHECLACRVAVVSGANVALDENAPPVPLRKTLLVRERHTATSPCPACRVPLSALVLAWAEESLAIESCERCDVVVVDRGELERIESMLDESSTLQSADFDRAIASATYADEEAAALERPLRRFLRRIHLL
jgi:Zn-finger nucleic acid-binding protein